MLPLRLHFVVCKLFKFFGEIGEWFEIKKFTLHTLIAHYHTYMYFYLWMYRIDITIDRECLMSPCADCLIHTPIVLFRVIADVIDFKLKNMTPFPKYFVLYTSLLPASHETNFLLYIVSRFSILWIQGFISCYHFGEVFLLKIVHVLTRNVWLYR